MVLLIIGGKTAAAKAALKECYKDTTGRLRDRLKLRAMQISIFMVDGDELHIEFKSRAYALNPRWYFENFAKTELAKHDIPAHDLQIEVYYG